MPIKIAISGAAGAGKSSIIRRIVEKFGYKTSDLGQVMRERAVKNGMTIAEYDKIIEKHPEEDIKIDNDFKKIVKGSKKNIIVSWRMGFHCLPEIFSIWLDVDPKEGARRIFLQDRGVQEKKYKNVTEAMKANEDRMKRLKKRLLKVYGVDFTDKKNYTMVIKTGGKSIAETAQTVIKAAEQFRKTRTAS